MKKLLLLLFLLIGCGTDGINDGEDTSANDLAPAKVCNEDPELFGEYRNRERNETITFTEWNCNFYSDYCLTSAIFNNDGQSGHTKYIQLLNYRTSNEENCPVVGTERCSYDFWGDGYLVMVCGERLIQKFDKVK